MSNGTHWYDQSGKLVEGADLRVARKQDLLPSVTSILKLWPKPRLDKWKTDQVLLAADDMCRGAEEDYNEWCRSVTEKSTLISRATAEWGVEFHELVECKCNKTTISFTGQMTEHWNLFDKWFDLNVDSVISTERVVTHDLGYAGKLDLLLCLKNGGNCLVDIKTRSVRNKKPTFYPEQLVQLAAYNFALPVSERVETLMSIIINRDTPKDPYVKVWSFEECHRGLNQFLALLAFWKELKGFYPSIKT